MKLLGRNFEKDGGGRLTLVPEDSEDIWHIYNLIQVGDILRGPTVRKVTTDRVVDREHGQYASAHDPHHPGDRHSTPTVFRKVTTESSTGSTASTRVHTTLTIQVIDIIYDPSEEGIHCKGQNVEENPHVKMGAHHTLDLQPQRKISITKPCWDAIHLDRIELACNPGARADVAAVVMQEGIAHVCLVTNSMTIVKAKIDVSVPRKRKGFTNQHEKGMTKFYDQILAAVVRHVNFDVIKCVILASPGFVKDEFFEFMVAQAQKCDHRVIVENRAKFVLIHSSSGFKHSLKEVLCDPAVMARLANTKAAAEVKALEDFYTMLGTEPDRAYYGVNHVERANENQAVETLMVTDSLFRSKNLKERKRYVDLVESVKDQGGTVRLFSAQHVTGEQLAQISGVAAILRFPMPEIEDEDEESD